MSAFEFPEDNGGHDVVDLDRETIAELQDLGWDGNLVDPSLPGPLNAAPPMRAIPETDGSLTIRERDNHLASISVGAGSHISLEDAQ